MKVRSVVREEDNDEGVWCREWVGYRLRRTSSVEVAGISWEVGQKWAQIVVAKRH